MGALGLGMPLPATASPVAVLQNDTPSKFATGVVVDKRTGETMPGAAVAVWQGGHIVKGVTTDLDGKFSVAIPKGDFEIRVTLLGDKAAKLKPGELKPQMRTRRRSARWW